MITKNFHTHTIRCKHAFGTEREYIETAIKNKMTVLGFADHTPYPFIPNSLSNMRMDISEFEGYYNTLNKLKEEYKNEIKILIGLEVEYFKKSFKDLLNLTDGKIDYMILSQHFLDYEDDYKYIGLNYCSEHDLIRYVDLLEEGVNAFPFSYIAHPDLIHYTKEDDIYLREMTRLCKFAKEKDIPLEFNFLGYSTNRHYPSNRFFKIAGEINNKVIVGIDAHEPCSIDLFYNQREQVEKHLKNLNLTLTNKIKLINGEIV